MKGIYNGHIGSSLELVNDINYCSKYRSTTEFMGFKQVDSTRSFGILLGGIEHVALHLFREKELNAVSDEVDREREYISNNYLVTLVLYGLDNTSYVKRFKTVEDANTYITDEEPLKQDDTWLWYNS